MIDMKELIFEYRFELVCILGVVLFALFEWEKFKGILYSLMLQAKSMAKEAVLKSGKEQEEWVLKKAYVYLPKWITSTIPKETMRKIIAWLYRMAKDYLDDGKLNKSV